MGNYYGVKEGRTPGVYNTWEECQKEIKGYSNAVYKKFKTKEEALQFISNGVETKVYNIDDIDGDTDLIKDIKSERELLKEKDEVRKENIILKKRINELEGNKIKEDIIEYSDNLNEREKVFDRKNPKSNELIAYIDGSYKNDTKEYSYGMIAFTIEGEGEYFEKFKDEYSEMRNVAGEIRGATEAMKLAIEKNKDILYLYYDYMGIEKWAKEEWKANKKGTQEYRDYYKSIKNKLKVEFIKVQAHSGDEYNDIADKLAKKALGLK